jgi:hypothetical protein
MRSEAKGLKGGKDVDLGGNVLSTDGFGKVEMYGLILTERCVNPKLCLAILQTVAGLH